MNSVNDKAFSQQLLKKIMCFKILFSFTALVAANLVVSEKLIVCYYGTWATYRTGSGKFDVADVNADLCTHLVYSFAGIDDKGTAVSLDTWLDLPDGKDNFAKFNALKKKNPKLKTVLAVGGWLQGSARYSTMAASPTLRQNFISSITKMVVKYGFDGCDMDWEYPAQRDSTNGAADIVNFSTLLMEMRAEFDKHGLSLSVAVAASGKSAKLSYDVPTISKYVDWIGLMAYDMHAPSEPVTGYNAPLFKGEGDENADPQNLYTVDNAVDYWLSAGCPPQKLVLGVPFYGKTFKLVDANKHSAGSPSGGPGIAGPYTKEDGTIGYNEICDIIKKESWNVKNDNLAKVPYAYKGNNWVSFDDAESLTQKVKYSLEKKLAGVMIWSIETDDFTGTCGEKYPLSKTINRALGLSTTEQSSTNYASSSTVSISVSASTTTAASLITTSSQSTGSILNTPESLIGTTEAFVCQAEGFTSNPENCSSFYTCIKDAQGELLPKYFECPETLYWDQINLYCNYANLVNCNHV